MAMSPEVTPHSASPPVAILELQLPHLCRGILTGSLEFLPTEADLQNTVDVVLLLSLYSDMAQLCFLGSSVPVSGNHHLSFHCHVIVPVT